MTDNGSFIIAGASQGLGEALSFVAQQHHYRPVLLARNEQKLQQITASLNENEELPKASYIAVDLTQPDKVQSAFSEINTPITALVNTAGVWTGGKSVMELQYEDMMHSLQFNFFIHFNTIKALLNLERQVESPLSIVNIGATAATRGAANMSAFACAKSALRTLSQSLARELGPKHVHVAHLIIDGVIDNEKTRQSMPDFRKEKKLKMPPISNTIIQIIQQDPSCWTFEWDVRPYCEKW